MVSPQDDAAAEMRQIMELSEKKNRDADITGMLTYDAESKQVAQILEGSREAVLKLYAHIEKDPRHTDLKVDALEVVSNRIFNELQMEWAGPYGYLCVDQQWCIKEGPHPTEDLIRINYRSKLKISEGMDALRVMQEIAELAQCRRRTSDWGLAASSSTIKAPIRCSRLPRATPAPLRIYGTQ